MDDIPHQFKTYVIDPILTLLYIFVGCSAIGWASIIWAGKTISVRRGAAGVFLSGAVGVGAAMWLWKEYAAHDMGKLIAISLLAGAGGAALIDLLLAVLFKRIRFLGQMDKEGDNKS